MATFTLLVEDSSPLVSYFPPGAWADTPNGDSSAASYSGRSLHTTVVQGATATLVFNGTGISIFGGQQPNYGTFTISVDEKNIAVGSAQSASPAFNKTLGQVSGLPNGVHTMVFTSTGKAPVDIDYVNVETQVGPPSSFLSETTYDDIDPQITYSGSWNINNGPNFINQTLHFTQNPNASASLSFSGDAVAVYGTMSPDHADIQIALDGQDKTFTGGARGTTSALRTKILLYYASDLGPSVHHLSVQGSSPQGIGPFVDLDSVTVYSAHLANNNPVVGGNSPTSNIPIASTPSTTSGGATSARVSSSSIPVTTIVGAAIGALAGLAFLLALSLLFLRWRRHRKLKPDRFSICSPVTPVLPMQWEPDMMEAGFVRITPVTKPTDSLTPLPPAEAYVRHSIAPTNYSEPSHKEHSRRPSASSQESTALILPAKDLPIIRIPRPPPSRLLMSSGSNFITGNDPPVRPSRRPPTMNLSP